MLNDSPLNEQKNAVWLHFDHIAITNQLIRNNEIELVNSITVQYLPTCITDNKLEINKSVTSGRFLKA